jgi:hypothetical protein
MSHKRTTATATAGTEADSSPKRYGGEQTRAGPPSATPSPFDLSCLFEERLGL